MAWEQNPYALKLTCAPDVSVGGLTQIASTNFSAPMPIFQFVYLTGTANPASNQNAPLVATVSAASTRPLGVLQNSPRARYNAAGAVEGVDEAEVTISGITKVVAGDSVTVGDALTIDASGRAVTAKFGVSSGTAQTATITGATASGTTVAYTTSSTTTFTVGQFVAVSGIVQGGTGAGSLNYEGIISAVGGSSGSYTFTITNPVASTVTYTSGGSATTTTSSTQYIIGTALASGVQGDIITAAIACHNAARAA